MNDFKIVHARNLLTLFSVAPIRGFNPPSIVVLGDRLNTASEILYNGVLASEFVISSSTRLIVRIPPSQVGKDLRDIQVFSNASVLNGDAAVELTLTKPVNNVSGIDRLVQSWLMIFLTTPGTDVFTPTSGGGGNAIIGSTTDRKSKSVAADLAISVQSTNAELLRLQAKSQVIPPQEKLLSSDLESVLSDDSTGTVSARVRLLNMLNQSASVSLS